MRKTITVERTPDSWQHQSFALTHHAIDRMAGRRLSEDAVSAALTYGRIAHVRGAKIFAIGRKEVDRYGRWGIDLRRFEGVQVVCSTDDSVMTVYRNRDFRQLRPRRRHGHQPTAA
jgi:hypothetical protein